MTTKIIAKEELEADALTLLDFLQKHIGENEKMVCVYVQDDDGRVFSSVALEKQTLSDGSEVFNLVLGGD